MKEFGNSLPLGGSLVMSKMLTKSPNTFNYSKNKIIQE